jgi:hypothetical protein
VNGSGPFYFNFPGLFEIDDGIPVSSARSGKLFPTREKKPSLAWVGKNKIVYIRLLSGIPASAYCLNNMLFEVAERIKWENPQWPWRIPISKGNN